MIKTQINVLKNPKLKNPICIVGLPGIGHIGRVAVEYMIHKLKAKKFATLYSPYFFPFVIIHKDKIRTLRNEFFYYKNPKGRDLILIIGDVQTYDPKGHYEVCGNIIDFLKTQKCKEIITIGGFATGKIKKEPDIYAVTLNKEQDKKLKKFNIKLSVSGKIGTIVGAGGLLIGLGELKGMTGFCLLGETSGYPIVTDPNAAENVLIELQKILKLKFDLSGMAQKVEAMNEFIEKLNKVQEQASKMSGPKKEDQLRYIG